MPVRVVSILAALSALALAAPAWAAELVTDINLTEPARVQGTTLEPGKYRVVATDDNRVTFMQGKKVVAEFQARRITLDTKPNYSALIREQDQIQEIHFARQNEAVDLRQPNPASD